MALVTIILIIAAVWILGLTVVVGLCRIAARGDRVMSAQRRWAFDSHEHPLAA